MAFRDYLPSLSRNVPQPESDNDQDTEEYGSPIDDENPSYYDDDDDCDDDDDYDDYGHDYDDDDEDDCDNGDDSDDGSQWHILQIPSEKPSVPTPTTAIAQPTGTYDPCDEEEENAPTQTPKLNDTNLVMANALPRIRIPWRRQKSQDEGAPQPPADDGKEDRDGDLDEREREGDEDEQEFPDIIEEPVPGEVDDDSPGEGETPSVDTPASNLTNSTVSYLMSKRVVGFSQRESYNSTGSLKLPRDGKFNTSLSSQITEGEETEDEGADDFVVDPEEGEEDFEDDDIDFYENDDDDDDEFNVDKEAQRQDPYRRSPAGDPYRRRAATREDNNNYRRRPVERNDPYRNRERERELEREHELDRQEKYRRARERENMYREREREKELERERERERQYRDGLERDRDEFYRDRDAYMRDREDENRGRQKESDRIPDDSDLRSPPPDSNDKKNNLKYEDEDFNNEGPFDDDHSHSYVPDDEYDYDDHPDHHQNHRHHGHSHRSHGHRNRHQDHHHLPIPDPHDIPIPFPNPHIPWHGHSDCGDDDSCYDDCRGDHCYQRAPEDCYGDHCNQRVPNDGYGYGRVPEDDDDDSDDFFNRGRNLLRDDEEDQNDRSPPPRRGDRQMKQRTPKDSKNSRSSRPPVDCSECLAYVPDDREREAPPRNRRIRDPQDYVRHPQNRSTSFSNYIQQKNFKNGGDGNGNQSYSEMSGYSYVNRTNAANHSTLPNQQNSQSRKIAIHMNRTESKQMEADSAAHGYAQTNMVMATVVVFVLTCFAYNIIF